MKKIILLALAVAMCGACASNGVSKGSTKGMAYLKSRQDNSLILIKRERYYDISILMLSFLNRTETVQKISPENIFFYSVVNGKKVEQNCYDPYEAEEQLPYKNILDKMLKPQDIAPKKAAAGIIACENGAGAKQVLQIEFAGDEHIIEL